MRRQTTRWVIQRRDGRFVCPGGVWGEDLGNTDMWVDRDLAAQAARQVDDRARVREVRVTAELELADASPWDATPADKEPAVGGSRAREPRINGLTIPDYVRTMERAHEATKNSQLLFK